MLTNFDQSAAVAIATRNAHVALTDPGRFFHGSNCYPMARPQTVGEHMFGLGLLATLPYLVTGDPIASFNAALILSIGIAGLTMYFFSLEFVRHPPAAFVAGLIFALQPWRVFGVAHPFAYADLWTPAALLFLHRTFAVGGLGNALALALFTSLEVAQSFYPLLWSSVLLLFYAVHLAIVHRHRLVSRLPLLLLSASLVAVVAWLVLGPYLETRARWGLLRGRGGSGLSPGILPAIQVMTVLAALGLVDRARVARPVHGDDPRLCLLVAAIVLIALAAGPIEIASLGVTVPSLVWHAREVVPGLDSVRALHTLALGAELAGAFLAGYGVLWIARATPRFRILLVAALSLLVLVERFHAPLALRIFGLQHAIGTWHARPADDDVALIRSTTGPTLDLPVRRAGQVKGLLDATYLLLESYSPRPSSSCFGSYASPLTTRLEWLAARLPDPQVADALHALGFRSVVLHVNAFWPGHLWRFENQLATTSGSERRLEQIGQTKDLTAYRLSSTAPVRSDLVALAEAIVPAGSELSSLPPVQRRPGPASIEVEIENRNREVFRNPDPIGPTSLVARWTTPSGEVIREQQISELLPLALGRSMAQPISVEVDVPSASGHHWLTLSPSNAPTLILARRGVHISEGPPDQEPEP